MLKQQVETKIENKLMTSFDCVEVFKETFSDRVKRSSKTINSFQ